MIWKPCFHLIANDENISEHLIPDDETPVNQLSDEDNIDQFIP